VRRRRLAQHFRNLGARGDRRVKYAIWDRAIASAKTGWKWVPYDGPNPHTCHVHLSVTPTDYDDAYSWDIARLITGKDPHVDYDTYRDWLGRSLHAEQIGRTNISFAAALDTARKASSAAEARAVYIQDQIQALGTELAAVKSDLAKLLARLGEPTS
jgi:hypothetical protein